MVQLVEQGFALSEASNTPVILQLRIRACHVRGTFICKDNVAPAVSCNQLLEGPAAFNYSHLSHPPLTFVQEKRKHQERLPAARRFIVEQNLNEVFAGRRDDLGLIVQGGLYNSLIRALQQLGLADEFGDGDYRSGAERHLSAGTRADQGLLLGAGRSWCWRRPT
jgi:indolepyruvate ferredoxin oxidoreductase alpha subunit